jgi:hypothetical protein
VSTAQQVIDEIGALVDEQLRQEASGYDWNLNQPRCRCGRVWHGLTRQHDRLGGACPGSDAEGPLVPRWNETQVKEAAAAIHAVIAVVARAFTEVAREVSRMYAAIIPSLGASTRCELAARRRMHSDQLRVQRRAARRARRRQ